MAKKKRSYFGGTPQTGAYHLFNKHNTPDQKAFEDLRDSTPFFEEAGDTATTTEQGLVKIATDAKAESRTSETAGDMMAVVMPHQLPLLIVDSVEVTTNAAKNGIKVTVVEVTATGRKRSSFKIELNPASIDVVSSATSATDYVLLSVGDVPKKMLLSNMAGLNLFVRTGTTLSPVNAGDLLDLGTGYLYAEGLLLNGGSADGIITAKGKAAATGINVHVVGGVPTSGVHNGGIAYIYGGAGLGGGINGNTVLCYDGSIVRGKLGIGGAADTTYIMKVTGSVWITGSLKVDNYAIGAGGGGVITDSAGLTSAVTFKAFMDSIVGAAPTGKKIIIFNGTTYDVKAIGTVNQVLKVTSGGDFAFADEAAIKTTVTYLNTATSQVLTLATIKDVITIDCTGADKTVELPLISTLSDGQEIVIARLGMSHKITVSRNASDGGIYSFISGTNSPTFDITGNITDVTFYCDKATGYWHMKHVGSYVAP